MLAKAVKRLVLRGIEREERGIFIPALDAYRGEGHRVAVKNFHSVSVREADRPVLEPDRSRHGRSDDRDRAVRGDHGEFRFGLRRNNDETFPVREPSLRCGGDSYKIVAFNLKPDQRRPVSLPVGHPDSDSVRVLFPILAATPCDGDESKREQNDSTWFHCG